MLCLWLIAVPLLGGGVTDPTCMGFILCCFQHKWNRDDSEASCGWKVPRLSPDWPLWLSRNWGMANIQPHASFLSSLVYSMLTVWKESIVVQGSRLFHIQSHPMYSAPCSLSPTRAQRASWLNEDLNPGLSTPTLPYLNHYTASCQVSVHRTAVQGSHLQHRSLHCIIFAFVCAALQLHMLTLPSSITISHMYVPGWHKKYSGETPNTV